MHAGAFSLFAGCPDIAAMIFNNLFDNGKADTASALSGISGGVRPIEALKDFGQVFGGDSLSVVFYFNPYGIQLIQYANVDLAFGFRSEERRVGKECL